jgi:hypothetical protein
VISHLFFLLQINRCFLSLTGNPNGTPFINISSPAYNIVTGNIPYGVNCGQYYVVINGYINLSLGQGTNGTNSPLIVYPRLVSSANVNTTFGSTLTVLGSSLSIGVGNTVFTSLNAILTSPSNTITLSNIEVAMDGSSLTFTIPANTSSPPGTYNLEIVYETNPGIGTGNPVANPYNLISDYQFIISAAPPICFKENTKILCYGGEKDVEVNIQDLKRDMLVKTLCNRYLPVNVLGKNKCYNPKTPERIKDRLYKLRKEKYPELKEDLIVTGSHSILVDHITDEQRSKINKHLGRVYVTDNKYRLMTCVDERSEVYKEECGEIDVYHVALGSDESRNYGIYANGLLVESCFINRVKKEMKVIS